MCLSVLNNFLYHDQKKKQLPLFSFLLLYQTTWFLRKQDAYAVLSKKKDAYAVKKKEDA